MIKQWNRGNCLLLLLLGLGMASVGEASQPLLTFSPLTSTVVALTSSSSAQVSYQVTNQSTKTHSFSLQALPGMSSVGGASNCGSSFSLAGGRSCILGLALSGSEIARGTLMAPKVCDSTGLMCYLPNKNDLLQVVTGYTIGGDINGLSGSVTLSNNAGDLYTTTSDGMFHFATALANQAAYSVAVVSAPEGQTCTVSNGSGVVLNGNIENVQVQCSNSYYTVGGTVSGLPEGDMVILNDGEANLSVTSNGSFTFPTHFANASNYGVTVQTQPGGASCSITNGTGTISGSNVTNVGVSCAVGQADLSVSAAQLALYKGGNGRVINVLNRASANAVNMEVSSSGLPSGTSVSTSCSGTLPTASSCQITITPGNQASNSCDAGNGSAPTAGTVTVQASNANPISTSVWVLNYGCIYQDGYLFNIDDTTSVNSSIAGTVVSAAEVVSANIPWAPAQNSLDTNETDGAANTQKITNAYGFSGEDPYAAKACANYSSPNSFTNWYLPAICQMAPATDSFCADASIVNNISDRLSVHTTWENYYWSSTEQILSNSSLFAYIFEPFRTTYGPFPKTGQTTDLGVRCAREIT